MCIEWKGMRFSRLRRRADVQLLLSRGRRGLWRRGISYQRTSLLKLFLAQWQPKPRKRGADCLPLPTATTERAEI